MTERDMIRRLRRSGTLDGLNGSGPSLGEPVLFWAEREPGFYIRATAISALLMAPVAFFLPTLFIVFLAFLAVSSWINARTFRFEVGPRTLTIRQSILMPRLHLPLSDFTKVEAHKDPGGRLMGGAAGAGLLLLTTRSGRVFVVPGLKDVQEAVSAIRTIQSGQGGPAGAAGPAEPGDGDPGDGAMPAG